MSIYTDAVEHFYIAFNMDLSDVRLTILLYNVTITSVYGVPKGFK